MSFLFGSLESPIWAAIFPALLFGSYFLLGLLVYCVRVLIRGRFRDAEIESRGDSPFIGMGARNFFAWVMQPIWRLLVKLRMPPDAVTTFSVLLASAAGVSVAVGRFSLGGWLYLFSGACDFIDGRLARVTGRASKAGAALDSTLDRYAESAFFMGLAWYFRESWVLLAVFAAAIGSLMVSYVRARGEGLGVDVKVGLMQRPERLVLLGVVVAFSPVVEAIYAPNVAQPIHRLAAMGIVILAISANITALRRLFHVLGLLGSPAVANWRRMGGRGGVLRSLVAASVATGIDFLVVVLLVSGLLVSGLSLDPRIATALGCIVGGVVNFTINRIWTFNSHAPTFYQAWRYLFVSASSAVINSGGVAVLLFLPGFDYRIAWVIVRTAVFLTWNYPLHRDYVFTDTSDESIEELKAA